MKIGCLALVAALVGAVAPGIRESTAGVPVAVPQESLRYVDPLVMENAGRLADPTVIKVGSSYYLYLTGSVSPRRYKIEVSADGRSFTTVVDKTGNRRDNAVEFDEIAPVEGRYVRLTIADWPADLPVGVLECTVFARPVSSP